MSIYFDGLTLQADDLLKRWKSTQVNQDRLIENLIEVLQNKQIHGNCNSFIAKLKQIKRDSDKSKFQAFIRCIFVSYDTRLTSEQIVALACT